MKWFIESTWIPYFIRQLLETAPKLKQMPHHIGLASMTAGRLVAEMMTHGWWENLPGAHTFLINLYFTAVGQVWYWTRLWMTNVLSGFTISGRSAMCYPGGGKADTNKNCKAQRSQPTSNNLLWLWRQSGPVGIKLCSSMLQPIFDSSFRPEK